MKKVIITVELSDDVADSLSQLKRSERQNYVSQLISDDFGADRETTLTPSERANVAEQAKKLDAVIDQQLLLALTKNPDALANLPPDKLAQLAVQRAPKAKAVDQDVEALAVGMTNALKELPNIKDIHVELNRTKHLLEKREREIDINRTATLSLRQNLRRESEESWNTFKQCVDMVEKWSRELTADAEARGIDWEGLRMLFIKGNVS